MLKTGWAERSITPDRAVMLMGQMNVRVSVGVENPVIVTALALENDGEGVIFLSCDLVHITSRLLAETRRCLQARLPGFDPTRLVMHATHTHTSLVYEEGVYTLPLGSDAMTPTECFNFITEQAAEAAAEAWRSLSPGLAAHGYGFAVVGRNRRACYADDSARMYGATDTPAFQNIEGYEDHGVHMLYLFDERRALTGIVINLACPSQETENDLTISADFWHEVREGVKARYGKGVRVLPQCAPAGDQSPHLLVGHKAENYMLSRRGITRRQEIARRILAAVEDVLPVVEGAASADLPLRHQVEEVTLPGRIITPADADYARAELQTVLDQDPAVSWAQRRLRTMLSQYEAGGVKPDLSVELHAVRLGEIAFATNPFELYLDFATRIHARSRAEQTFLIQIANGTGSYLPSRKAVAKHYGGLAADNQVGPEGGQILVDRTLEVIAGLWQ